MNVSCIIYAEIRAKYQDILGPSPTLPKLLDTLDIKKLGKYILELKQYRENKLQNVDNNVANDHEHVTNAVFQEPEETTNADTLAPLGLSIDEAENQRRTRRPRVPGFKATQRDVEAILKIRERELHRLEAMARALSTLEPTSRPFDPPLLFERLGWK